MFPVVSALFALAVVAGSGSVAPEPPSSAPRSADWRVELLTMGPGQEAYSRFGHSALRIRNLRGKTDLVFNFGTFDDQAPDVVGRFLAARLQYFLSVDTFEETREEYRQEGRRLVAQELALTPMERRALFLRLRLLAKPEHREYRYHPFEANCSTRVRDELDRALGGLLLEQLRGRPAATHRHWLRRATRGAPAFHLGFDLVLTRSDRPIDRWEACFAPEQLMRGVASLKRGGVQGTRPLVTATRVLLPGPGFGAEGWLAPWVLFMAGALLLAALIFVPPLGWRRSTLAWRLAGAGLVVSGLTQVVLGAIILTLWSVARVPMFRANPSLVLVPPTAAFWMVAGLWAALRAPGRRAFPPWMVWVGGAHLWALVIYALARLLQEHPQGNSELLLSTLVVAAASQAVLLLGRAPSKKSE